MVANLKETQTLTFFFSDIEGSTVLWEENAAVMSQALAQHDSVLRTQIEAHGGQVFKTVGDGFYATFNHAHEAVAAAVSIQISIKATEWPTSRPIKVRMALHTGPAEVRDGDFFGNTLNRLARLLSTGYGGQILLSQATTGLVRDYLPDRVSIRDLGQHRLKDLDVPEHVGMVVHPDLKADFSPLKSLDARPNNLPRLLSNFVGRLKEMAEAKAFLLGAPLLTLVGAGGTGKSRLSIELGSEVLDLYPDGVWFVELTPLQDGNLIAQVISTVLGIREEAKQTLSETLIAHLKNKRTMLILDNCEHVLKPAANLVSLLLQNCPNLSVLATSREPLRIGGEQVFRVPSLSAGTSQVKRVDDALKLDAVRLLVDRAKLSNPRFELTEKEVPAAVQICRQLDGIPFAIELAASRLKVLTLSQIADRLRDRFKLLTSGQEASIPRQQTLRATIEWSYDLLSSDERELLGRLSIFAGGWTIEAAEEICPTDTLESWDVLDGLMRLVDKSLVIRDTDSDETRFLLPESIRQYAQETLSSESLADLYVKHARFFGKFATEAEDGIQGPDQADWLRRVDLEHDNLRSVFSSAIQSPEILQSALEIAGAIGRFWTVRGYYSEGRRWIESLLLLGPPEPSVLRANAYRTAGQLAYWQGDSQAGRRFGEASLAICRELGDRDGEARSLFRVGFACLSDGDHECARGYFEEALQLARSINDQMGIPHLENAIGEAAALGGNIDEAKSRFRSALEGFRRLDDQRSIASVLKNLANVAIVEKDFGYARSCLNESLALREGLGNPTGVAVTLDCFGLLATAEGDYEKAVFLLAASQAIHQERGSRPEPSEAPRIDEAKEAADSHLGTSEFDRIWSLGSSAPLETVLARARAEEAGVMIAQYAAVKIENPQETIP